MNKKIRTWLLQQESTQAVTLRNEGGDAWRGVTLSSPALDWVQIQGPLALGDIPPGGNVNFSLNIAPPANLAPGVYDPNPLLEVRSSNAPAVPIQASITITSSNQGNALFNIINADQPRNGTGQGVAIPGTAVSLVSRDVAGLSFNATADANGLARFTDIPTGNYAWTAQASGFQTTSGSMLVQPGFTSTQEVLLLTGMVTYEWSVTPTTIQDVYEMSFDLTFRTDVPAPAIVIDPPHVTLPLEAGQIGYTQYMITNKGLISAFNVSLTQILNDPAVQLELPFTTIPELKAGQTVTVPVKVTLIHSSCHEVQIGHFAGYECAAGTEVFISGIQPFTVATGGTCVLPQDPISVGVGGPIGPKRIYTRDPSLLTDTPGQLPCTCSLDISGPDILLSGQTEIYTATLKQVCPCSLDCNVASEWSKSGDLSVTELPDCRASVTATGSGGGAISLTKGGLATCSKFKQIMGCGPRITSSPSPAVTRASGSPIAFTASYPPGCPTSNITWSIDTPLGGLSPATGNSTTFTPGATPGQGIITATDNLGNRATAGVTVEGCEIDLHPKNNGIGYDCGSKVSYTASLVPPTETGGKLQWASSNNQIKVSSLGNPDQSSAEIIAIPLGEIVSVQVFYTPPNSTNICRARDYFTVNSTRIIDLFLAQTDLLPGQDVTDEIRASDSLTLSLSGEAEDLCTRNLSQIKITATHSDANLSPIPPESTSASSGQNFLSVPLSIGPPHTTTPGIITITVEAKDFTGVSQATTETITVTP